MVVCEDVPLANRPKLANRPNRSIAGSRETVRGVVLVAPKSFSREESSLHIIRIFMLMDKTHRDPAAGVSPRGAGRGPTRIEGSLHKDALAVVPVGALEALGGVQAPVRARPWLVGVQVSAAACRHEGAGGGAHGDAIGRRLPTSPVDIRARRLRGALASGARQATREAQRRPQVATHAAHRPPSRTGGGVLLCHPPPPPSVAPPRRCAALALERPRSTRSGHTRLLADGGAGGNKTWGGARGAHRKFSLSPPDEQLATRQLLNGRARTKSPRK